MNVDSKRSLPPWLPLTAGLAIAVLGMVLLWTLVIDADEDAERSDGPAIVAPGDLSDAAERVGHPIYWAGERPDTKLELVESDSGRVYVRYLDPDAEPGVRSTDFMTVATYPVEDAAAALRRGARSRPDAELARGDDGATILIDPATPGNVRLAYPGADEQVELYTPDVEEGIRLATDGGIQPVP